MEVNHTTTYNPHILGASFLVMKLKSYIVVPKSLSADNEESTNL